MSGIVRPAKAPPGWLRVPDMDWPLVHAWEMPCGEVVRFWAGVVPTVSTPVAVVRRDADAGE